MSTTKSRTSPAISSTPGGGLIEHFRQLLKVAPVALVIALIAGGVTFAITHSADPKYQVVATAQIDAQIPVINGDAYIFQNSAPYLALSTSSAIHQTIAERMGPGWDSEKVSASVIVGVSKSPLLLDVTASAPTPEEAAKLAAETITVLDDTSRDQRAQEFDRAVARQTQQRQEIESRLSRTPSNNSAATVLRRQLEDVQGQINNILSGGVNGLSALSTPDAGDAVQTAPRSPALAAFVALVTFIIAAEALAFGRNRFGRRVTPASAERMARGDGIAVDVSDPAPATLPAVSHALTVRYHRQGGRTQLLASPATEQYVRQWHADLPDATVMAPAGSAWQVSLDDAVAQAVLVVGIGESFRPELRRAIDIVRELGLAGRIVLIPLEKSAPAAPSPVEQPAVEQPAAEQPATPEPVSPGPDR